MINAVNKRGAKGPYFEHSSRAPKRLSVADVQTHEGAPAAELPKKDRPAIPSKIKPKFKGTGVCTHLKGISTQTLAPKFKGKKNATRAPQTTRVMTTTRAPWTRPTARPTTSAPANRRKKLWVTETRSGQKKQCKFPFIFKGETHWD